MLSTLSLLTISQKMNEDLVKKSYFMMVIVIDAVYTNINLQQLVKKVLEID